MKLQAPLLVFARGARSGRRGLTFLELTVVMAISLVAVSIFSTTVVATARQRAIDRERSIAAEAARSAVERMRNENFLDVFALYNADPDDDPGGPGTAPGHRIAVPGLRPLTSSQDGMIGEIIFPAVELDGVGGLPSTGPVAATNSWELREDIEDPGLGMPRDLNGDLAIDSANHADDYVMLPVLVRLEWNGATGDAQFRNYTMLIQFDS